MTDTLRTRIAAVLRLHQWRATVRTSDDDPVLDCTCGMAFGPHREAHGNTFDCYRDHVADAVIRELETWDTLMELLDSIYPTAIFPTLPDNPSRDPGPRIISLLRLIHAIRYNTDRKADDAR